MNYEKRFQEIRNFLKLHGYLYQQEMLITFDRPITEPYNKWINELSALDYSELTNIENNFETSKIKSPDLIELINKVKALSELPKLDIQETKLENFLTRKMNNKKVHEIQTLKSIVDQAKMIDTIIDIGSGAGHLSMALVHGSEKKSYCIDLNSNFQSIGKEKLKRWCPENINKINFINKEVTENTSFPFEINKSSSLLIGLHSCGALSTELIKQKFPNTINFGCCYHKLKDEYNISKLALKDPLYFSNHALTLAAKSNPITSDEIVMKKISVKKFRYALYLYLRENLEKEFLSIGNTHKTDYELSFAEYAQKYAKELKDIAQEELNTYYQSKEALIEKIIKAGSLRALFARLIEIYLILDRAIYLSENLINIKVYETFSPQLSPRNIGIFSANLIKD